MTILLDLLSYGMMFAKSPPAPSRRRHGRLLEIHLSHLVFVVSDLAKYLSHMFAKGNNLLDRIDSPRECSEHESICRKLIVTFLLVENFDFLRTNRHALLVADEIIHIVKDLSSISPRALRLCGASFAYTLILKPSLVVHLISQSDRHSLQKCLYHPSDSSVVSNNPPFP